LQAVFDRGHRVGELARERFTGGTLIDFEPWKVTERLEATTAALENGANVVFEASFAARGVFAALDVLERRKRGWGLVEVKATLDVPIFARCRRPALRRAYVRRGRPSRGTDAPEP
jgi:hypothetical protein